MRFAKIVFTVAGVWGIVVLTPLYFLHDITGRQYPPPADYAQFFYGFLSVAMAWQVAFLVIGSSPAVGSSKSRISGSSAKARASPTRFRMPPEICEGSFSKP